MQQLQINTFKQGSAVFKSTANNLLVYSQSILIQLQKDHWEISDQFFQSQKWKQVFDQMIQCQAVVIYLWDNQHSQIQILKQIQHPNYTMLKELYIQGNNIENIQSLLFINFNALEQLSLSNNHISRITCLNKLAQQSLNWLCIYSNQFTQINSLSRSKINQNSMKRLALQWNIQNSLISQDLSQIIKLNSKYFNDLYIKSDKRINQLKIMVMLKSRYPSIELQTLNDV